MTFFLKTVNNFGEAICSDNLNQILVPHVNELFYICVKIHKTQS